MDIYETDSIWWYSHLRHTTTGKYDNNGKGWYFRFDDDNKMIYKYILSIYITISILLCFVFTSWKAFKLILGLCTSTSYRCGPNSLQYLTLIISMGTPKTHSLTHTHKNIFVVVNFDALAQACDIGIERRQVVFLCWMQDSNQSGSQTPNRQQT